VLGHSHPRIIETILKQSSQLLSHGNLFTSLPQIELAELLIEISIPGVVFFCHSGAEADEAALKLVRKATSAKRHKIISFENCFHGRTMGGLSLCPPSFQQSFKPMLPGNILLPFNDLDAVTKTLEKDEEVAGIFIEPIQGEGGINESTIDFMKGLRMLCDKHGILLVCDEVWSAPARTGKWFAYQRYDIKPDAITCAKAIGGGVPLACCIIAEKWKAVLGPGSHGCTMGGNPLAAACGLTTLQFAKEEKLTDAANKIESFVKKFFSEHKDICSEELLVKGKGALLGVKLADSIQASDVAKHCIASGVFVCAAKQNVLRLAPPLIIEEALLTKGLELIASSINKISNITS
ncbi:UNVERIFIED_CONTAM: hypothetical protein GTU68_006923, partial [Idotea baltica]|nr:hypothetical protein [Idotea baltica]